MNNVNESHYFQKARDSLSAQPIHLTKTGITDIWILFHHLNREGDGGWCIWIDIGFDWILTVACAAAALTFDVFHVIALAARSLGRRLLLDVLNYLLSGQAAGAAAMLGTARAAGAAFLGSACVSWWLLLCFRCLHWLMLLVMILILF